MKVVKTQIYRGPNFYSGYQPVICLTLDLEELEQHPSDRLGYFSELLLEAIPTLEEHHCSEGVPGGFVTRLQEGTWLGHIIEHIVLELQTLVGTPVSFGKTRGTGQPGVYEVVFEYQQEKVGLAAADLAMKLARSLLPPHLPSALPALEYRAFNFEAELEKLTVLATDLALGPSTRALVEAAEKRDIPWIRLDEQNLVQLGYGKYQQRLQATVTSATNQIAVEIASDKRLTNQLLADAGVPVPRQALAETEEAAVEAAEQLGYPVVTKPLDLSHGRGASLNLGDEAAVRDGFRQAVAQGGTPVVVETYLTGNDYRVLIVNDKLIAVAQRIPGHVVGDGVRTIQELVDLVNADPRRGLGHEKVLTRIVIDHQARRLMKQAGVTLKTVLPAGQMFCLRSTANMSTGGTAIDRTTEIHYENAELARRGARIIGLDVAGIDIITPDISQPLREVGGGMIEVNAAPGFRMHIAPTEGQPRDVAGPVIDMLFPKGRRSRIPIAAITGTNGKTTTAFMVSHILKMAGYCVGLTSTDGIYIDGQSYLKGDMTGPWSARMVLKDSKLDAAVFETARGGILREGLGFDRCDVGAILNVTADHLGLRGVETIEQMAQVKSLVIETVAPSGYAVLNADDPLVASLAEASPGQPFYFCMSGKSKRVKEHICQGGRAVVLEKGINGHMITLYDEGRHIPVLLSHLIPATLEGRAKFNVANALAATAIAYGLGISVENICQGLRTFATTFYQVPGRLNVFDELGFRVIVDYGHNPAAMQAMSDLVKGMRRPHKIGVIAAPGDWRDSDIKEIGQIAGSTFDELIIKEDDDLRGRQPGEVASILKKAALEAGLPAEHIRLAQAEFEAIDVALQQASPGDLVVIFADDVHAVWSRVTTWSQNGSSSIPYEPEKESYVLQYENGHKEGQYTDLVSLPHKQI
jgi:cyanophycin synthetase